MANKPQGPWGGGGGNRNDDDKPQRPRPPQNNGGVPEIDDLMRKGQEQLRVLMGGKGGGGGATGAPQGFNKGLIPLFIIGALILWAFMSFYRVDTSEQSVELRFGKYHQTGTEGLNFAAWPIDKAIILPVTRENTEEIGAGSSEGLMLTGDENIVDIDFQVVWNITDPAKFLFNLAEPRNTINAVSESAMREIIARSTLAPILNTDRGVIAQDLQELIQTTLDSYNAGVNIVRINFDRADPPREVIDAFREVQAAEQTRDTLEKQADAYSNKVVAEARGESARQLQEAEGYRAQVVNEAEGEASRFIAVYDEYVRAPEVTRKRLYLETMERVLGGVDKIIIDEATGGGDGVVKYLPLNELRKSTGSN